ncbi:MAG: tetratricopeptide repeat protein [Caldilineaceae bacterium]|nr:tetratricopeptide repeat protein [Caldilineaceae bacterium]
MPKKYPQPRYKRKKTEILRELREAAGLSQEEVANIFGMGRADSVRDWETGYSSPRRQTRARFIQYLLVVLRLQHDHGKFQQVWNGVMVDEWGWDPLGPDEAREYFGDQAYRIVSGQASAFQSLAPLAPAHQLVGRNQMLRDVKARLLAKRNVALCALSGKPGAGKTAVAIALAHDLELQAHFRDRILWAGVGRGAREQDILEHLALWASVLGISPDRIDRAQTLRDRAGLVHRAIGMQRILIVIDDVWDINFAIALRVGGDNCAHLVTTRLPVVAIDFAGEATNVQELDEDNGLALLSEFVPQLLVDEEEMARELVGLVDGLPLGIVIMGRHLRRAAASGHPRRLREVVAQLRQVKERIYAEMPLSPLEAHPSRPDRSYVSIAAAIEISDDALDGSSRRALRALSVFPAKPNSFSEDAALAVCAEPLQVVDTLVDAGLLESSAPERYMMHQSIHDYGTLSLTDLAVHQRMATYYADYVLAHEQDHELLAQDYANITAATVTADERGYDEELIRLCNGFADFLIIRGHYSSAVGYLQKAHQVARVLGYPLHVIQCLRNMGRVMERQGNLKEAEAYLSQGVQVAEGTGEEAELAALLLLLGIVKTNLSDFTLAQDCYESALKVAEKRQDVRLQSHLHQNLGILAQKQGALGVAARHFRQALLFVEALGDQRRISGVLGNMGALAYQRGHYKLAKDLFTRVLGIAQSLRHLDHESNTLGNLGLVAAKLGDTEKAMSLYNSAISVARKIGLRETLTFLLRSLGTLLGERGEMEQERSLYLEGLDVARALGHKERIAQYLLSLGAIASDEKKFEEAQAYYKEGRALAEGIGSRKLIADFDRNAGIIAVNLDDYATAEKLFERSLAAARSVGLPESEIMALTELGEVYLMQDKLQPAQDVFQQLLGKAEDTDSQQDIAAAKFGLGRLAAKHGDYDEAATLGQESYSIYLSLKHRYAENIRAWLDALPAPDTREEVADGRGNSG